MQTKSFRPYAWSSLGRANEQSQGNHSIYSQLCWLSSVLQKPSCKKVVSEMWFRPTLPISAVRMLRSLRPHCVQSLMVNVHLVGDQYFGRIFFELFFSSFYKSGNFVAAINAFTAAIVLDGSLPAYPFLFTIHNACISYQGEQPNSLYHFLSDYWFSRQVGCVSHRCIESLQSYIVCLVATI